ncbi:tripartite tricarboxylate transporter TctB family protein [Litoreibacter meonggei]|uniref:Tripartite tricarboxylate transporter TctB family protein n=1 Tax=Litoreibacter meonggei TaxID=1049199 RepID=A0A497WSG6_9RHOB|nr:tripartite tricarboxylate transporter TctB family protein [Litoreibacter meonggei]RLJ52184.1 tripartite tricarboxylate transporter TctB family protein [Litoreibacter meonggei]
MDPDFRGDSDHHDGTSDATPGGYIEQRRPGELGFAIFLTLASLFLLYNAYGISGFKALSSPGSVPMATTLVMAVSAFIVTLRTSRLSKVAHETLSKDILPIMVILFIGFLIIFGLLLKPLGFVLTAALFLTVAIKVLARKGWGYTLTVALGSLVVIWIVFRVVFTVLLPAGILPEAEFIQFFRNLMSGGAS